MLLFATFWEPVRMDQGQELSSSCSQAEQGPEANTGKQRAVTAVS